jgi:hypothetical protein
VLEMLLDFFFEVSRNIVAFVVWLTADSLDEAEPNG